MRCLKLHKLKLSSYLLKSYVRNYTLRISEAVGVLNREMKEVSFVTWIQEWMSGAKGKAVHNYLSQIETLSKVNGWMDEGFMTAILQGLALEFLSGQELVRDGCSYENLKRALVDRFSDKLPDQYYYTRSQHAAQGRDESAEEFGDQVCVIH